MVARVATCNYALLLHTSVGALSPSCILAAYNKLVACSKHAAASMLMLSTSLPAWSHHPVLLATLWTACQLEVSTSLHAAQHCLLHLQGISSEDFLSTGLGYHVAGLLCSPL